MAGLQRTPAAYANEAALAISGRAGEEAAGARGPGSAPPGAAYIAGSALPGAQVRLGGPEPAGAAAAPAQGAGSKLWRRPRGAVSAGAPGSPLYRVSAPPPAPRAAPPRRRPAAPPGESGRGQGSGRRLCLPGGSGAAPPALRGTEDCPAAFVPGQRVAAPFGVPVPLRLGCPLSGPSLPAPVPSSGSQGGRPGSEAHGRSGAECARRGGRTSARPTFRFGSGAGRAAPPLPSPLSAPPPLRSPPFLPPLGPSDSRATAPPAATTGATTAPSAPSAARRVSPLPEAP